MIFTIPVDVLDPHVVPEANAGIVVPVEASAGVHAGMGPKVVANEDRFEEVPEEVMLGTRGSGTGVTI